MQGDEETMEKWRKVQIEALDTVDHMLDALGIPHKLIEHDEVDVINTSLWIKADYDNWSDTVTASIWNTDDNDDTRTIWGMTLPYRLMDELMGHLYVALIPMMKRHMQKGKNEDGTESSSDGQKNDREFVRSIFNDLTRKMKKECHLRGIGTGIARTVKDDPAIMVRDQKIYYGNADMTKILQFSWDKADNTVTFAMMPSTPNSIPDDCVTYTVDELRGIDRVVLWGMVFAMVIISIGPVITA